MSLRFSMAVWCKALATSSLLLATGLSSVASADNSKIYPSRITLLPSLTVMSYTENVRFSQVLTDAFTQIDYDVYPLGVALVDPHKQPQVDVRKRKVLLELRRLNTDEAYNLAQQLRPMRLAYHLPIEPDPVKVLTQAKRDPLITQEYGLRLPKRPDHIQIIDPSRREPVTMAFKPNADLQDYMAQLSETSDRTYESAWIIQADRQVYRVEDVNWRETLHFLSPGAVVFMGLRDLPQVDHDLNNAVAELLALRLEL